MQVFKKSLFTPLSIGILVSDHLTILKITVCFHYSLDLIVVLHRLGCPGFTLPEYKPTPVEGGASKSLFFPDEAINKHPRFR